VKISDSFKVLSIQNNILPLTITNEIFNYANQQEQTGGWKYIFAL
jgi:hypothetical protein